MDIENATIAAIVTEAVRLNNEIESLTQRLDMAKSAIRSYARGVNYENKSIDEKVVIETVLGKCTVTFSKDRKQFKKGSSPEMLSAVLPPMVFNKMFETKLVFSDKFDDTFSALDKDSSTAVSRYIEYKQYEPSVTLPKVG